MLNCYKVIAYVELDVEKIVNTILDENPGLTIEDIDTDTLFYYVDDNISYLDRKNGGIKGIREVQDGPSLDGFEQYTYDKIYDELERIKQERTNET